MRPFIDAYTFIATPFFNTGASILTWLIIAGCKTTYIDPICPEIQKIERFMSIETKVNLQFS